MNRGEGKGTAEAAAGRLDRPHPARLDPARGDYDAVIDAHATAMAAGAEGYRDPGSGLFVWTARTLLERGACCQSGCRHCPWVARPGEGQPGAVPPRPRRLPG